MSRMLIAPPFSLHTELRIWVKLFPLLSSAGWVSIVPKKMNVLKWCSGLIFSLPLYDSTLYSIQQPMNTEFSPEVDNKGLSSPFNSSAAVQGHCDLLSVHLVELHLDIMDAGRNVGRSRTQNTLPCRHLSRQGKIILSRGILVLFSQNSEIVFTVTWKSWKYTDNLIYAKYLRSGSEPSPVPFAL